MIKVLLTAAGGSASLEMIRAMRAAGRYEIVGVDAYPYSAAFPLVDHGYVVPFGADPTFTEAFRKLLRTVRPDFVISTVDEELPIVHRLITDEGLPGRLVAPRLEFCELALDKWLMSCALQERGLGTARTWLASDAANAIYPAIVKPRTGRGSRGLAFLNGPRDLDAYLTDANEPADRYIVQERLVGREMTTSAVVTLDGRLLAVVPKEAVEKRGITRVGVTRRVPTIDTLCAGIQRELRADGPFNVQLILDANDVPRVFEVNPRYSTTTALTIAAGLDELDVVMRAARGEAIEPLSFKEGVMMIRHETQFFTDEQSWKPRRAVDL